MMVLQQTLVSAVTAVSIVLHSSCHVDAFRVPYISCSRCHQLQYGVSAGTSSSFSAKQSVALASQRQRHGISSRYEGGGASTTGSSSSCRTSSALSMLDTSSRLNPMLPGPLGQWLHEHGGVVDGVYLEDDPLEFKGWGIKAGKDLLPGDVVVRVPRHLCISPERVGGSGLYNLRVNLRGVCDKVRRFSSDSAHLSLQLGLAILSERTRPCSTWETYIFNLPKAFTGMPIFFLPTDVKNIHDLRVHKALQDRTLYLRKFSERVLAKLPGTADDPFTGTQVDLNVLGWGLALATTRGIYLKGRDRCPELVPYIDMANHSFSPNSKIVAIEVNGPGSGYVDLVMTEPVRKGAWVEVSYGPLGNHELLMDYGFTERYNPFDSIAFDFNRGILQAAKAIANLSDEPFGGGGGDTTMYLWQQKFLQTLRLDGVEADCVMTFQRKLGRPWDICDDRLLAALRILFARSEKELAGRNAKSLLGVNAAISTYNERRVLAVAIGVCKQLQRAFGASGSAEKDELLLYGKTTAATADPTLALGDEEEEEAEEKDESSVSVASASPAAPPAGGRKEVRITDEGDVRVTDGHDESISIVVRNGDDGEVGSGTGEEVVEGLNSVTIVPSLAKDEPVIATRWGGYNADLSWEMIQVVSLRLGHKTMLVEAIKALKDLLMPIGLPGGVQELRELEDERVRKREEKQKAKTRKMLKDAARQLLPPPKITEKMTTADLVDLLPKRKPPSS